MFNKIRKNKYVIEKSHAAKSQSAKSQAVRGRAVRGQKANKRNAKNISNKMNAVFLATRKIIWRPKLLAGLSVIFISLFSYNNINLNNVLPIESVKIEGEFKFLDREKLQQQVLPVIKGGFFNVNLTTVRNTLVDLPWVENVSVRRQWPGALMVRVIEQTPVVLWGEDGVISTKGKLFIPEVKPDLKLPHLTGPQGQHKNMLEELARMQAWLLETGLFIKNLELDARRSWILTMTSGMELRLGRKQMHERLNRFVSVYKETLEAKMLKKSKFGNTVRKIKHIDMRYTNGFAVAWKEA